MGWLAAWIFVPALAVIFGAVVSVILKLFKKITAIAVIQIIVFSVIIHSVLMFEESYLGLIRNRFDSYASKLNIAEKTKKYHEVELGDGRFLYFEDERKDESYRLSFEYRGQESISKDEILRLASGWLASKPYQPGRMEISLSPPIYRKDIFSIKNPGKLSVSCDVKNRVLKDGLVLDVVYLDLVYRDGEFTFVESAQAYSQVEQD